MHLELQCKTRQLDERMTNQSLGNLFIVASPSGGGKTSLIKCLVADLDQIKVSVSHTTRDKRAGEVDGEHYYFVDEATFFRMKDDGQFIEHAQVFNHYYGTSRHVIEAHLQCGVDVVLDIDWQGAQQIKRQFTQAVSVFILPPSLQVLEKRLLERQLDDHAVINERMQRAQQELSHYDEFDFLIVNDEFNHALAQLMSIVVAERLKRDRQVLYLAELLSFLLQTQ